MRDLFLFYLLSRLFGNPLRALLVILLVYLVVDRKFVGLLPDLMNPLRRRGQVRELKQAIAVNPADAESMLELGALLLSSGRAAEALPYLEQAGKKLDDHANALFYLGAAYAKTHRPKEAAAKLRKATALRPEVQYGLPYVYLAQVTLLSDSGATNDTEEAVNSELEEWLVALSRHGNAESCYRMGEVLMQAGRKAEATQMFRETLDHYQRSPAFVRRSARRWARRARTGLRRLGG